MKRKFSICLKIFFGFLLVNVFLYNSVKHGKPFSTWNPWRRSFKPIRNVSINGKWKDFNPNSMEYESSFRYVDLTRDAHHVCALPEYDIWYEGVLKEKKAIDPTANCDKSQEKWTELVNSTWRVVKEGADCTGRCANGTGATRYVETSDWMRPGRVDCEFLEVECQTGTYDKYGYIHSQVIPKPLPPTVTLQSPDLPNVIVITVDSMNTGMARRMLPNFLRYFSSPEYEGTQFPFVNKVGENSKPNGFPLWFGKATEYGRRVDWSEITADWDFKTSCQTYLDNQTSIFNEFRDRGYATMLGEDWMMTLLDCFPTCEGFEFAPVDHNFRLFASILEVYGNWATMQHLNGKKCREIHMAVFEYLEQALEAYKDRPLFSWTWLTTIAHYHIDGVGRMDQYLVDYFKKNKKHFDNSFVLFVSDHGFRFGKHLTTELGSFERDNPFLAISIPKHLRDPKYGILEALRTNSKQLQTHYDTRATLLDILKYQPDSKFMARNPIIIPNEKGNSLIRRQPDFPRTCATLPIPQLYCICQVEKRVILDEDLKTTLGQKTIDHIHQQLAMEPRFKNLCATYELDQVTSLLEFAYTTEFTSYRIALKTKHPHSAYFETVLSYDETTEEAKFEKVLRLDGYSGTVECTDSIRHEPLCACTR